MGLEVTMSVYNTNLASLGKVVGNKKVLLVGTDLEIVGSNDALIFIGVVETLDVVEIRDVERSDVVADGKSEVGELAVVSDVGVDGEALAATRAEIEE